MEAPAESAGRERILEVAERLFTEHGYRAVTVRDIARDCRVTSAALYYYYPSKEALFEAVLERHAAHLNRRMRQAGETPGTCRQRSAAMLWEYTRIAADRRSPVFLLRRDRSLPGEPRAGEQHARLMHAMLAPLEELLREAAQSGELGALAEGYSAAALLVGMVHGMIQFRQTCLGERIERGDIEQVVRVFWDGLGRSPAGEAPRER